MSDRKYSTSLVKHHDEKMSSGPSRRHDDNDKYGGSRRDRDNRDRGNDEGRSHSSSAGVRFIPCTMRTLHGDVIEALCQTFKVSVDKVADWCDEEYIRIDTTKDPREEPVENIDPLRQVVSKHDWENWEKMVRRTKNNIAAERYYQSKGIDIIYDRLGQEEDEDDSDSD